MNPMNQAAKAIRQELAQTRKDRRELEQQEKRLGKALEVLEAPKPTRTSYGPRISMKARAEEILAYLRAHNSEVTLRVVLENTDVPKTSIYAAVELLQEQGSIIRAGANGHVSIDDQVRAKSREGKPTTVIAGKGVRK